MFRCPLWQVPLREAVRTSCLGQGPDSALSQLCDTEPSLNLSVPWTLHLDNEDNGLSHRVVLRVNV